MNYPKSQKYATERYASRMMGPNPIKLEEELLLGCPVPIGAKVLDLGSGQGVTSVFLAREYGFDVTAADLWSDPDEISQFFDGEPSCRDLLHPVHADATALPFEKESFDAVFSTDSYNYFGRDPAYLGRCLLPFLRHSGYMYFCVPGMKRDCHDALPKELLLSWTPEQMEYMHDPAWWRALIEQTSGIEVLEISEMESLDEVWADWLRQENPYAVGDRLSMENGGGAYLNFIKIVLRRL